jgi:hypothetical protein
MKLKPLLIVAGAAGAVAALAKRRGAEPLTQAAAAVPQPVKDAAQSASQTVQRAVESAPGPVKDAVDKVTGGGDGAGAQGEERYAPPAEALAQEPTEAGGPPSDATQVRDTPPAAGLNVPEHGAPEGSVMPDTSDDDPLVRQQEKAAESDAASIGGSVDPVDPDPAMEPVVEGAGDENEETFETREGTERGNREVES